MQDDLSLAWYRIVKSGDEKHLRAGCAWEVLEASDAAIRYAAKHAAKPHQKAVPELYQSVGRFWGGFGGVKAQFLHGGEVEEMNTLEVCDEFGMDAISHSGKVKKYIWDSNST